MIVNRGRKGKGGGGERGEGGRGRRGREIEMKGGKEDEEIMTKGKRRREGGTVTVQEVN